MIATATEPHPGQSKVAQTYSKIAGHDLEMAVSLFMEHRGGAGRLKGAMGGMGGGVGEEDAVENAVALAKAEEDAEDAANNN